MAASPDPETDLILSYLEGRATADQRDEIGRRLVEDASFAERVAFQARMDSILLTLRNEDSRIERAAAYFPRRARSRRRRSGRTPEYSNLPWAVGAAVAACALFVLLLIASIGDRGPSIHSSSPPSARAEPPLSPGPEARRTVPAPRIRNVETRIPARPPSNPYPSAEPGPRKPALPTVNPARPPTPVRKPATPRPTLPSRVQVATLRSIRGSAMLIEDARRTPIRAGQSVAVGQGVATGEQDSRVILSLNDGTEIALGPKTLLRTITTAEEGKDLAIASGTVEAEIAPQPAGRPLTFTTPHAQARVLGTRLRLDISGETTHLEVTKGRVRLIRSRDGRFVDVRAGYYAVAGEGVPLVARRLRELTLFEDDFSAHPVGRWPEGWNRTSEPNRAGFRVMQDSRNPRQRFMGCPVPTGGTTQHAILPVEWRGRLRISLRFRLSGPNNDRAGMEIWGPDGIPFSVEYNLSRQALLIQTFAGTWKEFARAPLALQTGRWYQLHVISDGTDVECRVDNRKVLAARPATGQTRGTVSLASRGQDSAHFDDVRLLRP